MLDIILTSVRYFAHQGLAPWGDTSEESNLVHVLNLQAKDNPLLLNWLRKPAYKYTSPENQNEMLMIMTNHVLQKILVFVHTSPFLSIMVDEATDSSNKEQLAIIIQWADDDLTVFEDFLGLYHLNAADAESIVAAMKDVLLQLQIHLSRHRGQCYDGFSNMAGRTLVLLQ